jgi:hypothetical protein
VHQWQQQHPQQQAPSSLPPTGSSLSRQDRPSGSQFQGTRSGTQQFDQIQLVNNSPLSANYLFNLTPLDSSPDLDFIDWSANGTPANLFDPLVDPLADPLAFDPALDPFTPDMNIAGIVDGLHQTGAGLLPNDFFRHDAFLNSPLDMRQPHVTPPTSNSSSPGQLPLPTAFPADVRYPSSHGESDGADDVADPTRHQADKRQRNKLAARKCRQKRLDRIAELEEALASMTQDRDGLRLKLARKEAEVDALREVLTKK